MNEDMINRLIKAIESPDYSGIIIQVVGIIFPLVWAVLVAKNEAKKTKEDIRIKNQILDNRQEKLERIQSSINDSINMLTKQQLELSTTQQKVEENLRELTRLAELSRNANILNMEISFPSFFEKYKVFEKNFTAAAYYRSMYLEKEEDFPAKEIMELRKTVDNVNSSNLAFFDSKEVPNYVYKEFENLKHVLLMNSVYPKKMLKDYYLGPFLEIEEIVNQLNRKLDQK
ncbi:hypothetical protein [Enterococcus sp. AZ101]|uniref:hypothetical protein n=1 Tax=Enterococcus sp. AZ101 TaxID=2774742 RepID=UPI003D2C49C9